MPKEYAPLEPLGWPAGPPVADIVERFKHWGGSKPKRTRGHRWDASWTCEYCGLRIDIALATSDECLGKPS